MTLGEVFTALGYAVGALVFWWASRQRKLNTEGIGRLALVGLFGGIIGAKVTQWVMEGWPFSQPATAVLNPTAGGRALLGGLLVGWLCVEVAKRRMGIRRSTGDLFALALPAGEAVGRIGCYFNQCCYGTVCDASWAVHQHGADRHPVQLYSSIVAALVFGLLVMVSKHVRREGDLFRMYLGLFGLTRFWLEFFRERSMAFGGLSAMQWFCLELVVASAIMLTLSHRRSRAEARA